MTRLAFTGAAGAIGPVLRPGLLAAGHTIRSADRAEFEPFPGEEIVTGDLREPSIVDHLLRDRDTLLHFAGTSVERPLPEIIDNNLVCLHALFEGARQHGIRRVVFASSNHAFGMHEVGRSLGLDAPYRPDGLYGLSKMWGEGMARLYWDKYGLQSVSLRIGTVAHHPTEPRHLSTWLGHDDLLHLVRRAVEAPDVGCVAVWGISNNRRAWWDNAGAEALGYAPSQNAEDHAGDIHASDDYRYMGGRFAEADGRV